MALTGELAEGIVAIGAQPLPATVEHEAARSLLNVIGTAVRASDSSAAQALLAGSRDSAGQVRLLGRVETRTPRIAALINATSAHFDDFDDTHLATVIHPGATSMAGGFAVMNRRSGPDFLRAFALGVEVQLRVGLAMTPHHYDGGWHITGTCGAIGAAVTGSLVLGGGAGNLSASMGIAATIPVGHRESFGTMLKPVQVGLSAAHGVEAALLAHSGLDLGTEALDGPGGFFHALSSQSDTSSIVSTLGQQWHLLDNTYKPYPCGIVTHPALDAAIALHVGGELPALTEIREIHLRCHPLVPELTGKRAPGTGLEARFSTVHGVAMALVTGRAGPDEYDGLVGEADIVRLRNLVSLKADPACPRDSATLTVVFADGSTVEHHVEHARGSRNRPLTDAELLDKFVSGAETILGANAEKLADMILNLQQVEDASELLELATPHSESEHARRHGTNPQPGSMPVVGDVRETGNPQYASPATPIEWLVAQACGQGELRSGPELQAAEVILGWVADPDPTQNPSEAESSQDLHIARALPARDRAWMLAVRSAAPGASTIARYACVIASAVLSLEHASELPSWQLFEAVSAGMDVAITLASYLGHDEPHSPWDSVGTVAGVAAAVAASRLMGQDETAVRRSIALAAVQAGGLAGVQNTAAQALVNGRTAAIAVEAATLGMNGVTGPDDPIDGRRGLSALMSFLDGGAFTPGRRHWVDEVLADPRRGKRGSGPAPNAQPTESWRSFIAAAADWTGISVPTERAEGLTSELRVHKDQVERLFDVRLGEPR